MFLSYIKTFYDFLIPKVKYSDLKQPSEYSVQRIRIFSLIFFALLLAADPTWRAKTVADWTEQDARDVLESSPWAKVVLAGIAPRESEDQRREGGNMGQSHGVGYDGIDDRIFRSEVLGNPLGGAEKSGPPLPVIRLLVRWESALPVRAAEFKVHESGPPTLSDNGYTIAVYGIPVKNFKGDPKRLGEPFKNLAALRRNGKDDVKPASVEVFQLDGGAAVVYRFPLSAEISARDTLVEFSALIGRLRVSQMFHIDQMQFGGKLEI
jgi:hypothetical protein